MIALVGDALLDRDLDGRAERLAPDAPVPVVDAIEAHARPGGAGLAAALAAAAGHAVVLVCALGDDSAGRELRALLGAAGVTVADLGLPGATPEKVRVRAGGRALVRLDHGGEVRACGPLGAAGRAVLAGADAVLVSDYGRGVAAEPTVRAALASLPGEIPLVWDPHPHGPPPVAGATLATPNAAEALAAAGVAAGGAPAGGARARAARTVSGASQAAARGDLRAAEDAARAARSVAGASRAAAGADLRSVEAAALAAVGASHAAGGLDLRSVEAAARALLARWRASHVAVTMGERGALVAAGDGPALAVPAEPAVGDPCGAGDCFAATAVARLAAGALPSEAVRAAVDAASAFVAAGGASRAAARGFAAPAAAGREDPRALAARVRAGGGTVVATGGCFDLLHAGHVRMLAHARALGDCLIVCLNSDASVRRLKGPDRPLVAEPDRAAVLAGLACVDAVVVFDEDDPRAILRALRPHVWAKGGDYAVADLPEAATLAGWGGQAVVVPYVAGKSTTRLIEEARAR